MSSLLGQNSGWLAGLGHAEEVAHWLYLLSWKLCMWGALQHLNATLGFSGPASVPYCKCALA